MLLFVNNLHEKSNTQSQDRRHFDSPHAMCNLRWCKTLHSCYNFTLVLHEKCSHFQPFRCIYNFFMYIINRLILLLILFQIFCAIIIILIGSEDKYLWKTWCMLSGLTREYDYREGCSLQGKVSHTNNVKLTKSDMGLVCDISMLQDR